MDFEPPPPRRLTRQERKRNAELVFAREFWRNDKGLAVVRSLKGHCSEMRWLAELFPLDVLKFGSIPTNLADQRLSEWCETHPEDARALVYFADLREDQVLLEKAVSMGDPWALGMFLYLFGGCDTRRFELAVSSTKQGDAMGTYVFSQCIDLGRGCEKDERLAFEWLVRAADLGSYVAYRKLLKSEMDPAEKLKLATCFFDVYSCEFDQLTSCLEAAFQCHADKGSCGEAIFYAGEMLKGKEHVEGEVSGKNLKVFSRAIAMFEYWYSVAENACVAWILTAKRTGVNKDVRKIIARMIWNGRSEARASAE